jgi:bla regulator protein blaR1
MMRELANHLWQSTLFAAAAGLLTLAFRKNRASVRYWLWFSATLKFFVPFALLISLGSHLERSPVAQKTALAAAVVAPSSVVQLSEPLYGPTAIPRAPRVIDWPAIAFGMWACGFLGVALVRVRGWLGVQAAVRASSPLDISAPVEVRSTPGLLEPGVIGLFRPVLFLPLGIEDRLTSEQLRAVLAHELCHVRRRDNLFAAVHMVVEAVFWFHPLTWWIGARLVEERERACDEEVLCLGNEPQTYAEGILNVCKLYIESPLVCVSGVTGADLKNRIHAILAGRLAGDLSLTKKLVLTAAAITAVSAPIIVGLINAPYIKAQSAAAARPQFEVASIKSCSGTPAGGGGPRGGTRGGGNTKSPGALYLPCLPLRLLLQVAYAGNANGQNDIESRQPKMEGLPSWVDSERYSIAAKAEGNASQSMMNGPMLQTLLEDRLKVKVHYETREVPIFELVTTKGGLKMTPTPPGGCTPRDSSQVSQRPEPGKRMCDTIGGRVHSDGRQGVIGAGATMNRLALMLSNAAGRPVFDKTAIKGSFDFEFEFARQDSVPAGDGGAAASAFVSLADGAPSIFTALAAFGLKLEPAKGPVEFLVIDHIERPSEN